MTLVEFEGPGLIVQSRWRRPFTISYGEILTAERLTSGYGLRLHTRTADPLRVACRGRTRRELEDELRTRGVRIVDEYGAMITPTLAHFEAELARNPDRLRQSSDSA